MLHGQDMQMVLPTILEKSFLPCRVFLGVHSIRHLNCQVAHVGVVFGIAALAFHEHCKLDCCALQGLQKFYECKQKAKRKDCLQCQTQPYMSGCRLRTHVLCTRMFTHCPQVRLAAVRLAAPKQVGIL